MVVIYHYFIMKKSFNLPACCTTKLQQFDGTFPPRNPSDMLAKLSIDKTNMRGNWPVIGNNIANYINHVQICITKLLTKVKSFVS